MQYVLWSPLATLRVLLSGRGTAATNLLWLSVWISRYRFPFVDVFLASIKSISTTSQPSEETIFTGAGADSAPAG